MSFCVHKAIIQEVIYNYNLLRITQNNAILRCRHSDSEASPIDDAKANDIYAGWTPGNYARPTTFNIVNNSANGWLIGGQAVLATIGDPLAAPVPGLSASVMPAVDAVNTPGVAWLSVSKPTGLLLSPAPDGRVSD